MSEQTPRSILVTGGAGYIGSHTCVELLNANHSVVVVDNLSNSSEEALSRVQQLTGKSLDFVQGDIRDSTLLDQVFAQYSIDAVIHFAGLKAVGESQQIPLAYFDNNIAGSISLVKAMERAGVFKLVFSSSATVYDEANTSPLNEDMPTGMPSNNYGYTKLIVEQMLEKLAIADTRWSIALLRYFNPVGAHQSGQIGEDPQGIPNNLMPFIAQVASGERPFLSVFGDDYDTPDGTGVRDYVHVMDLVEGHAAALDYLQSHAGWHAFNLGTGQGISVLDVIRSFEKASGRPVPYQVAARRAGDLPAYYADAGKANRLLGWQAHRDLDEMCRSTWNFQQRLKQSFAG